ncbi:hypothetical protein BJY04DRAFT_214484 [Aspergillus karnatakaensis]|uniref:class I SAM-dependent methyltransferase n=1 Tax=Aspergillus karnatakaensis TaxID=1810916 RepID=UPI003CCD5279
MSSGPSPSHVENYDASKFWVAPARNFRTSARLHLQHFLFQNTLGPLLDPTIENTLTVSPQHLKVADLACGNGIWLTELHTHFAKNNIPAQLDGFDINPVNFPSSAFLPDGVSFRQLDILAEPLPAELIGAYDIIHIRAFVSVIPDSNLTPILTAASTLLKPGGLLQWDESRGDRWTVESPSPSVSSTACTSIVHILNGGMQQRGIRYEWVDSLDAELAQFGFQDALLRVREKRRQDFKGWTEDYLMVWEELADLFPPKAQAPNAPISREAWVDLFAGAVKETEQGVVVHQGRIVVAVGRKGQ